MSVSEKTWSVFKSIVLYQEAIKAMRDDMAALSKDVVALSRAHASLSERVSRLEGFVQGATRTPFRPDEPARLPE
ncbi:MULTISPECIES: hypothetical protein [unclassified Sphingomonas]|uniref:hypothetical protein n=1 Tax=unclassified Sphingomonas TaxID=196159 RepID=UPI001F5AA65C|nr:MULTISPECIES: hypothetical protein [unclassified Sphingomonas]